MRSGCLVGVVLGVAVLGLAGASLWVGFRLLQEPPLAAAIGSPEDGVRGQQKIFEIIRGQTGRRGSRPHQVVLTEAELNQFLSRHLVEVARMPLAVGAIRLAGDGIVEFKASLSVRDLLAGSPFMSVVELTPSAWLDRRLWLDLKAKASLEVGASRSQRRYLRFDPQQLSIGRQPVPLAVLGILPSPGLQSLLRWRMPDTVDGITIDQGVATIRTSS